MSSKSSLRQMQLQVRMVLAVCAVLATVGYAASAPKPIPAQQLMRGQSELGDMQCISYCSTMRRGTALMEVKWRLADRSLNEAELRSKIQQQGLEVTVYSEGFERGLFATVSALKPKAQFRARTRGDGAPSLQRRQIPGLEEFSITDVSTRLNPAAESLRLMTANADSADNEWVTIRVEGLNTGMEYSYRVSGGQSVVTCQAIVCPADLPIPRNRANIKTNR